MARGKKNRRSYRLKPLSKNEVSQRLHASLAQQHGEANGPAYNEKFRAQVEAKTAYTPENAASGSLIDAFLNDLVNNQSRIANDLKCNARIQEIRDELTDHLARFENELALDISNDKSHEEIQALKARYLLSLQDRLIGYAEEFGLVDSYNSANFIDLINKTSWYASPSLLWARFCEYLSPAAFSDSGPHKLYKAIDQYLQKQIDATHVVHRDWRLWDQEKLTITPTGNENAVEEQLQALKTEYESKLFALLTTLDNDPHLVTKVKALQNHYQQAFLQQLASFKRAGVEVSIDTTAQATGGLMGASISSVPSAPSLADYLKSRFNDNTAKLVELRSQMNASYVTPKETLQQWRYQQDKDRATAKDKVSIDAAADFGKKATDSITAVKNEVSGLVKVEELTEIVPDKLTPADDKHNELVKLGQALKAAAESTDKAQDAGAIKAQLEAVDLSAIDSTEKTIKPLQESLIGQAEQICLAEDVRKDCQGLIDEQKEFAKSAGKYLNRTNGRKGWTNEERIKAYKDLDELATTHDAKLKDKLEVLNEKYLRITDPTVQSAVCELINRFTEHNSLLRRERVGQYHDKFIAEVENILAKASAPLSVKVPDEITKPTLLTLLALTPAEQYHNELAACSRQLAEAAAEPSRTTAATSVEEVKATLAKLDLDKATLTEPERTDLNAKKDELIKKADQIAALQTVQPLVAEYEAIANRLIEGQHAYAKAVRSLLDIEYLFDKGEGEAQLAAVQAKYSGEFEPIIAELEKLKEKADSLKDAASKEALNKKIDELKQQQADTFAAIHANAAKEREQAIKAYQEFDLKFQWYMLREDPLGRERYFRLDEETRQKIAATDPKKELDNYFEGQSSGQDRRLDLGLISVSRNERGTYVIHLTDIFAANNPNQIKPNTGGKVSYWDAFRGWLNRDARISDIQATLSNPQKLDQLATVLQTIAEAKTPPKITYRADGYSEENYLTMLAVHMAAIARGLECDPAADFDASFHGEMRSIIGTRPDIKKLRYALSKDERKQKKVEYLDKIAQFKQNHAGSLSVNKLVRDIAVHGVADTATPLYRTLETQLPDLKARLGENSPAYLLIEAAAHLSHRDHHVGGLITKELQTFKNGFDSDKAVKSFKENVFDPSKRHLSHLSLLTVKGIMARGGEHAKNPSALMGISLEKDNFVALLAIKKQAIDLLRTNLLAMDTAIKDNSSLNVDEINEIKQDCNQMWRELLQEQSKFYAEVDHYRALCAKQGLGELSQQQAYAQIQQQMSQASEVEAGRKIEPSDLITALQAVSQKLGGAASLKQEDFQPLWTLGQDLAKLEGARQLQRDVAPQEKSLLESLVNSPELQDPEALMQADFEGRAHQYVVQRYGTNSDLTKSAQQQAEAVQVALEKEISALTAQQASEKAKIPPGDTADIDSQLAAAQAKLTDVKSVYAVRDHLLGIQNTLKPLVEAETQVRKVADEITRSSAATLSERLERLNKWPDLKQPTLLSAFPSCQDRVSQIRMRLFDEFHKERILLRGELEQLLNSKTVLDQNQREDLEKAHEVFQTFDDPQDKQLAARCEQACTAWQFYQPKIETAETDFQDLKKGASNNLTETAANLTELDQWQKKLVDQINTTPSPFKEALQEILDNSNQHRAGLIAAIYKEAQDLLEAKVYQENDKGLLANVVGVFNDLQKVLRKDEQKFPGLGSTFASTIVEQCQAKIKQYQSVEDFTKEVSAQKGAIGNNPLKDQLKEVFLANENKTPVIDRLKQLIALQASLEAAVKEATVPCKQQLAQQLEILTEVRATIIADLKTQANTLLTQSAPTPAEKQQRLEVLDRAAEVFKTPGLTSEETKLSAPTAGSSAVERMRNLAKPTIDQLCQKEIIKLNQPPAKEDIELSSGGGIRRP